MDRRQKKTREAIFNALCDLLSKKQYNSITVGEIIELADVGRATFYSHFETKDTLLSELCRELFCHIFDMSEGGEHTHRHIFECDAQSPVFLHLLRHLEKNDHNILRLLSGENNEVFLRYFKENLGELIKKSLPVIKEHFGTDTVALNSQSHAESFYAIFGFKTVSEEFLEAGVPHVKMEMKI